MASSPIFGDEGHGALRSNDSTGPENRADPDLPVWRNRAWQASCLRFFRSDKGGALLAKYRLAERTALIGVAVIASFADRGTGQNMFAAYDTIGALMTKRLRKAGAKTGARRKTVANLFAILLHDEARLAHRDKAAIGCNGKGRPNVYSLLIPDPIPARIATYQKVVTTFSSYRNVSLLVTKSAGHASETKQAKPKKPRLPLPQPSMPLWKFASDLARLDSAIGVTYSRNSVRTMARSARKPRHLAELARAAGTVVNAALWTAEHWVKACDLEARAHGWSSLSSKDVRNPVRLMRKRAARFSAIPGVDLEGDPHTSLRAMQEWSNTMREELKTRVDLAEKTRRPQPERPEPEQRWHAALVAQGQKHIASLNAKAFLPAESLAAHRSEWRNILARKKTSLVASGTPVAAGGE